MCVTSGAGGLLRPNIPVAVVDEVTRDGAIARLLSNPAATDFVTIEPVWQSQAVELLRTPPGEPGPAAE